MFANLEKTYQHMIYGQVCENFTSQLNMRCHTHLIVLTCRIILCGLSVLYDLWLMFRHFRFIHHGKLNFYHVHENYFSKGNELLVYTAWVQ